MKETFTYEDMKLIGRKKLGDQVPLELFRTIRLIGMQQALPMGGKGTTVTIGRKIGASLPVSTVEDILSMFEELRIGIPKIVYQDELTMRIAVDDCFCKGLPVLEGKMVCDLEGAILEGALRSITNKNVTVREVKCNVNGDEHCVYEILNLR
ncbi:V4R domain-containing protein [Paenibacillus sp. DMB20]|uniref:V4R domain-containing protein n=1 Tax=Paenibacillus sp. DMB20 TaxID=1642570 RepID=UPI000627733E|nr:V4R domain-containing protein [Paenibacillus sp. DMB20]KKO55315.1 4-vinyl reductase [Paenibacillus sp. DMB20]